MVTGVKDAVGAGSHEFTGTPPPPAIHTSSTSGWGRDLGFCWNSAMEQTRNKGREVLSPSSKLHEKRSEERRRFWERETGRAT